MTDPVHPDHEASLRINQGPCTAQHEGICREHWFSCGFHTGSIEGTHYHSSTNKFALERSYEDARFHLRVSL